MGDPCYTGESTHQCDGCCNLVSGAVDMVVRPCVIMQVHVRARIILMSVATWRRHDGSLCLPFANAACCCLMTSYNG